MSNITLRDYHHLIETLLDSSANSEAIFHCTHILESFPKEIKTYQQLGQALLENKRYADADEVFTKVLSALPDDFMAHAGLSAIHEENRDLDKAIWHMERAFETQPSNPTIQDELRRLISRRDGAAPSKIRLTRGALIRMYAKGELYQQAIAEAQGALQAEPERIDLKLLLAKMYMLTNDYSDASDICSEILNTNPYCFEANRFMFEISASLEAKEKPDDIYLQKLIELDPYYDFIESVSDEVKSISADKVTLEKADYVETGEESSITPDWVNRIGIPWHEGDDTQELPLNDVFISDIQEETLEIPEPSLEITDSLSDEKSMDENVPIEDSSDDIPEWIAKAGWIRASDSETSVPAQSEESSLEESFDEEKPIEEQEVEEASAKPAEELPDWLRSLNPEGEDSPQIFASTELESIQQSEIPPLSRDMLSELLSNENKETDDLLMGSSVEESEESVVSDLASEKPSFESQFEPVDDSIPDLPDWLKDLEISEPLTQIEGTTQEDMVSPVSGEDHSSSEISVEEYNELDFIEEIGESDLVSELEPEITEEEVINIFVDKSQKVVDEIDQISTEVSSFEEEKGIADLSPIKEESLKEETKPAVPSWVRNILSNAESATNIEPQVATTEEVEEVDSDLPAQDEETVEELITELPADQDNHGVISEEVTGELETWLDELNPEEDSRLPAEIVSSKSTSVEDELAEISLENLSTSDTLSDTEEPISELEEVSQSEEEILERSVFDDRFSAVFETDGDQNFVENTFTTEEEISESEISEEEDKTPDRLLTLLKNGDYSTYLQEVAESDLTEDTSDTLIAELHDALQKTPEQYELWQNLGDLYSNRSDWLNAIKAYREAEKHIFS